jgi:hypothetical protein
MRNSEYLADQHSHRTETRVLSVTEMDSVRDYVQVVLKTQSQLIANFVSNIVRATGTSMCVALLGFN